MSPEAFNLLRNLSAAPCSGRSMSDALQTYRRLVPAALIELQQWQNRALMAEGLRRDDALLLGAREEEVGRLRAGLARIAETGNSALAHELLGPPLDPDDPEILRKKNR